MSGLKWFEIRFKDGSFTRTHEYDMENALVLASENVDYADVLSIEEVADGSGTKL